MKRVIEVSLWVFSAVMVYMIYSSVNEPIQFKKVKERRFTEVVRALKDIRRSQEAYRTVNGVFAPNFDELIKFIENGKFVITQQRDTSWVEFDKAYRIDVLKEKKIIDTLRYVSVKDSLFKSGDSYKRMMYVPGARGEAKFTMKVDVLDKAGFKASVFEARTPKKVVLYDQPEDLVTMENNVKSVEDIDGADIKVGSLTEISTTGNWPTVYDARTKN